MIFSEYHDILDGVASVFMSHSQGTYETGYYECNHPKPRREPAFVWCEEPDSVEGFQCNEFIERQILELALHLHVLEWRACQRHRLRRGCLGVR